MVHWFCLLNGNVVGIYDDQLAKQVLSKALNGTQTRGDK